jgi:hypothetical protein
VADNPPITINRSTQEVLVTDLSMKQSRGQLTGEGLCGVFHGSMFDPSSQAAANATYGPELRPTSFSVLKALKE